MHVGLYLPGARLNAVELVAILTSVGMYQVALKLCHLFSLPPHGVFEGLASACVKLMAEDVEKESSSAWDWLVENDFSGMRKVQSVDAIFLVCCCLRLDKCSIYWLYWGSMSSSLFSIGTEIIL
jgi:hypothetical protein